MNLIAKNHEIIDALKRAGYDTKIITEVENGYAVFVDLGLTQFDGPAWKRALKTEVKNIVATGHSNWA